jgi:hypothetical protein
MAGLIPLLWPVRLIPGGVDFVTKKFLKAEFNSCERMRRLVETTGGSGSKFSVTLVHARNDKEISYLHSKELFEVACAGDMRIVERVGSDKVVRQIEGGRIKYIETWWGGHNDVQKSDAVLKAVLDAWR